MPYRDKTTGEIISDEAYNSLPDGSGVSSSAPESPQTPSSPQPGGFLQRFKLSFGGSTAKDQIKQIEEQQGTRGKFDVGDIADVAGAALPLAGGIAGGIIGTPIGGGAVGAAAGQGLRRVIGRAIGADEATPTDIGRDVALTGAGAYVGGRAGSAIFTALTKYVPERAMSIIFRESADDIARNVRTGGLDKTTAREVLEEGYRGTTKTMMQKSFNTMQELEDQVKSKVKGKVLTINNIKGYRDLISTFQAHLKASSYGFDPKNMQSASQILNQLNKIKGSKIPAELGLVMRRFLDGVRKTSSFRADVNLAPKEAAFKAAADGLRKNLAEQIPEVGPLMSRYRIHINAFNQLADYAYRTQNRQMIQLIDALAGIGIGPVGIAITAGGRAPGLLSTMAQGLFKTGNAAQSAQRIFKPGGLQSIAGRQISEPVRRLFEDNQY